MEIGNKIYELRKKYGYSQEQLAEKINVTRQTISKWELNETSPDIKQAKELSKIFKISLDELVDNNVEDFVMQKVSNVEKLAGIIIKILKFIGIAFVVLFIIDLVFLIIFLSTGKLTDVESSAVAVCEIDNKKYEIEFGVNDYFKCENCSSKMTRELEKIVDFNNIDSSMKSVQEYFLLKNGTCK